MQKLALLLLTIVSVCFCPVTSYAVVRQSNIGDIPQHKISNSTDIPIGEVKNSTSRNLSLRDKLALHFIEKKIKKEASKNVVNKKEGKKVGKTTGKRQIVAFLLCLFLGLLGIHRFYLGYTGMGVLYIFTAGLFGIGWLVDLILLIIPNGLTPKGETRY